MNHTKTRTAAMAFGIRGHGDLVSPAIYCGVPVFYLAPPSSPKASGGVLSPRHG